MSMDEGVPVIITTIKHNQGHVLEHGRIVNNNNNIIIITARDRYHH